MVIAMFFTVLGAIFFPIASHAQWMEKEQLQKIYVEPTQIAFINQEIFAFIEGEWIPVEAVCSDAYGLYAQYKNPYHGRWRCPKCGFSNDPWQNFCQNWLGDQQCLTPRP